MSSKTPLLNAVAQSAVDFNSQAPSNTAGVFNYKIKNFSTDHIATPNELNSVCIFSGGNKVLYMPSFTPAPAAGVEIVFYATEGYVHVTPFGATLYPSEIFSNGAEQVCKIMHIGNNTWVPSAPYSVLKTLSGISDCCSGSPAVYQILLTEENGIYDNRLFFNSVNPYTKYDGTIIYEDDLEQPVYLLIAGGEATSQIECPTFSYSASYTLYTEQGVTSSAVTVYSTTGASVNDVSTLWGRKFFSVAPDPPEQYDCFATNVLDDVVYYATSAPGASSLHFEMGYLKFHD